MTKFFWDLVLIYLTSVIFTRRLEKSHKGGEVLLHVKNISDCSLYWLYDCSAIKEVLENNGSIYQLKRLSQEHLAYEFVCLHCPKKIMKDVDGVCRHISPLVHQYLVDAATIHRKDICLRFFAYKFDVFIFIVLLFQLPLIASSLI